MSCQKGKNNLQQAAIIFFTAYLRHNLRHEEKNNKKNTQAEGVCNQHLPLALSTFLWQNLQSSYLAQWARTINRKRFFGTKQPKCRRFLQHYYRDAVYRKPPKAHKSPYLLC